MSGVPFEVEQWEGIVLPEHLQMRYAIVDEEGNTIRAGRDLLELKEALKARIQASLEQVATPELEQSGLVEWSFVDLPETFTHKTAGFSIQGYPGLVAESDSVAIKIFDQPHVAHASHQQGLYKLIQLAIPSPIKYLHEKLPNKAKLGLYYNPFGKVASLIDDCIIAGIAHCVNTYKKRKEVPDIRDKASFDEVCEFVRAQINDEVLAIAQQVESGLTCANDIKKSIKGNIPLTMLEAVGHIKSHLDELVYPHFVSDIGAEKLGDWQRYLQALHKRVEKLKVDPTKDRLHQIQIDKINTHIQKLKNTLQTGTPLPETYFELRWMVEELRVSFFAQQLGTKYPISTKRIEQAIAKLL